MARIHYEPHMSWLDGGRYMVTAADGPIFLATRCLTLAGASRAAHRLDRRLARLTERMRVAESTDGGDHG